jgi:hypothetical protein
MVYGMPDGVAVKGVWRGGMRGRAVAHAPTSGADVRKMAFKV